MTSDSHGNQQRLAGISERWTDDRAQRANSIEAATTKDLTIANPPEQLAARQSRLAQKNLTLEGIVDSDDSLWFSFLTCGTVAARSVGRVVIVQPPQPIRPIGTCSLIADSLVLTNNHVCPTEAAASEMAVEFNYQFRDNGTEQRPDRRACQPDRFFLTDPALDFTMVAVAPNSNGTPAGKSFGYLALIRQTGKAVLAEHLNVIHHPGGDRKRISIRNNLMVAEDEQWIRYQSDTRTGSSGAPVFNDQWEMVALHHGGIRKTDRQGLSSTSASATRAAVTSSDPISYTANEGSRVSRIVAHLRQSNLDPTKRAMAGYLLDTEETPP